MSEASKFYNYLFHLSDFHAHYERQAQMYAYKVVAFKSACCDAWLNSQKERLND